jgi:hypothetical protein
MFTFLRHHKQFRIDIQDLKFVNYTWYLIWQNKNKFVLLQANNNKRYIFLLKKYEIFGLL